MVKGIAPLIRLDCKRSIALAKALNRKIIVIPIYDLILQSNANPNQKFKEIQEAGGIHNYLDYNGFVILSLIMRDSVIWRCLPEQYAKIIKGIFPDAYTTIDGATYDKKDLKSIQEIIRISKETKRLISLCPSNIKPIGHVKGCNKTQIKFHLNFLEGLGISTFLFHTGDFFKTGHKETINKAKTFCSLIKKRNNTLFIYGLGAPKRMLEFSFCDLFITYNHFITARYGKIFMEKRKRKYSKMDVYEVAEHNFKELSSYVKDLKYQTKLFNGGKNKWGADQLEQEIIVQDQKNKR